MKLTNEQALEILLAKGINGFSTFEELFFIEPLIPAELRTRSFTKYFILKARDIARDEARSTLKAEAHTQVMDSFKESLESLQREITEVTTHHFTNKRKGQLRKIVKRHFPELDL